MNLYQSSSHLWSSLFLNLILSIYIQLPFQQSHYILVIMILVKISVCLVLTSLAASSIIKICKETSPAYQVYGQQQNLQAKLKLVGNNMKFKVGDRVILYINDAFNSVQKTLQTSKQAVKTSLQERENATIAKQQTKVTKYEVLPSNIETQKQQINITNSIKQKTDYQKQQTLPIKSTPLPSSNQVQVKLMELQKQSKNQQSVNMPQVTVQSDFANTTKNHESDPITANNIESPPIGVVVKKKENITMSYIQYLLIYKPELITEVDKNTSNSSKDDNWTIVSENEKTYKIWMTTQKYIEKQKTFKKNVEQINKHNSDPSKSYSQGLNKFTDIDAQQFTQTYSKLKVPKSIQTQKSVASLTNSAQPKESSEDSKEQGMVTTEKSIKQ